MAVELIQRRWCDWHLREKDEQVEGVEFRVAFHPASHNTEPMIADLCEDCATRFGGELTMLIGTLDVKKQRERTPTAKLGSDGKVKPVKHEQRFDCPMGCGMNMSKSGIKSHLPTDHGLSLGQVATRVGHTLEGGAVRYVCPVKDCRAGYAKPQAYSQHRIQSHGDSAPVDMQEGFVNADALAAIQRELGVEPV